MAVIPVKSCGTRIFCDQTDTEKRSNAFGFIHTLEKCDILTVKFTLLLDPLYSATTEKVTIEKISCAKW